MNPGCGWSRRKPQARTALPTVPHRGLGSRHSPGTGGASPWASQLVGLTAGPSDAVGLGQRRRGDEVGRPRSAPRTSPRRTRRAHAARPLVTTLRAARTLEAGPRRARGGSSALVWTKCRDRSYKQHLPGSRGDRRRVCPSRSGWPCPLRGARVSTSEKGCDGADALTLPAACEQAASSTVVPPKHSSPPLSPPKDSLGNSASTTRNRGPHAPRRGRSRAQGTREREQNTAEAARPSARPSHVTAASALTRRP